MNDNQIEQDIKAAGSDKAPRITPADIEANIASEHYFTAADGIAGEAHRRDLDGSEAPVGWYAPPATTLLTFCVLVLKNGFTVTGESACASPENFDAELGKKIARQAAVSNIWPLMDYELRSKLAAQPADFRDRVRHEHAELDEKLAKLEAFIKTQAFRELETDARAGLQEQCIDMRAYSEILAKRIASFETA